MAGSLQKVTMWKKLKLFSGQDKITKMALISTFLFAVFCLAGWVAGKFQMWPTITSVGFHGLWVFIAYNKKIKISKTGLEFEEDEDEAPTP